MVEIDGIYMCYCTCGGTPVIIKSIHGETCAAWGKEEGSWKHTTGVPIKSLRPHYDPDSVLADFTAWRLING